MERKYKQNEFAEDRRMIKNVRNHKIENLTFVDLFAGCGGLSLGLSMAGWKGIFAVEKSKDAFSTFKSNFCESESSYRFDWPEWLPVEATTTSILLTEYYNQLFTIKGKIDLLAGGPPCQGFSTAGKRNGKDPRNKLTEDYVTIVNILQPKFIALENVRGFQIPFAKDELAYSEKITRCLQKAGKFGYEVFSDLIDASEFGVPQMRKRYIMIGVRKDINVNNENPIIHLKNRTKKFRESRNLNGHKICVREAIGDLEIREQKLQDCKHNSGFKCIKYTGRRKLTEFQHLMRIGVEKDYEPDSLRLTNHRPEIIKRFSRILENCPKGVTLSSKNRKKFSTKKQCLTPLHPKMPARTVTTLPDDMIHYKEPRILTVRENARLQTFPDWFTFRGKYTTGGQLRKEECPRYSQVGNAVPPLLAEAIGETLQEICLL